MTRRIGVAGGGQLGRMIGIAGVEMGFKFRFWDPASDATAGAVGELFQASFDDLNAAEEFVSGLDVITYEFENVPAATIERLGQLAPCRPGWQSLSTSQDRATEKTFFKKHGIQTGEWRLISSRDDLLGAVRDFGSCIVKTRRFGYDGKGQARVSSAAEVDAVWAQLGAHELIAERLVTFTRELSIIGVRGVDGAMSAWPLVENEHRNGILHKTEAPARNVSHGLQATAEQVVKSTMDALGHVGVLTIEFFDIGGKLLANEMAPRVHNSGHWTIEGAVCSQFENHVRAVAGLPLGLCEPRFSSTMINCLGAMPPRDEVARIAGAHYHDYGKKPRAGRKVGHITVCDEPGSSAEMPFQDRVRIVEQLCLQAGVR